MPKVVRTSDEIKCPACGGPASQTILVKVNRKTAVFLVECWSGDIDRDAPRHWFKQRVKLV